ncbi:Fic family protein [Leptospira bandrabouensis]|uniref:Fido domain-containing protein n=1 Tax=Leptospira bandrabouensis TaxID=2484903 RepID=A0A6H3P105_9LEPT|nr:Fic family protein [Leptospira bandrabouensis]MCG6146573.1 Fic family protein [Leptospira bandrabouensis]MCG6161976.1 Fic family protein [Leptospira bandrabouensis]MCG6166160.1 Fic family protein [Leptospira bandrabouensis]TGN16852.1 hypothetical protein EHR08_00050 [Leptospira bandrabouensis]
MNQELFYTEETIGYIIKCENGIKIKEKQFELLCRTPYFSEISEWRNKISEENINLSNSIQKKLFNRNNQNSFEILLSEINKYKVNELTKQYIEIIKELHSKKTLNIIEDLIHPFHAKIHTGCPICDIGEFRKQNVWFVEPSSENFNKGRLAAPPFESVSNLMDTWQKLYNQKTQNPILDSLLLYLIFEFIHPLENDNGKFGWLLLIIFSLKHQFYFENFILYPSIILNDRDHFYKLLENTINYNELNPLVYFLLNNFNKIIDEDFDFQIELKRNLF